MDTQYLETTATNLNELARVIEDTAPLKRATPWPELCETLLGGNSVDTLFPALADEYRTFDRTFGHCSRVSVASSPVRLRQLAARLDVYAEEIGADIEDVGLAAVEAYTRMFGEWSVEGFTDTYAGEHRSVEAFAQAHAEEIGADTSNEWPNSCIDWSNAARELMRDYSRADGHYFRNC